MNQEIIEFWQRNNTPIGLMVQNAPKHGVTAEQVELAAALVYREVQEIVENVPEIKPGMNGKEYEKVILLRNQLKKNMLGWRVFIVAKSIKAHSYDGELAKSKKRIEILEKKLEKKGFWYRLKTINWEIPQWQ